MKKRIFVCVFYFCNSITVRWSVEQSSQELTSQRKKDNNLSSRLEVKQSSLVWNVGI